MTTKTPKTKYKNVEIPVEKILAAYWLNEEQADYLRSIGFKDAYRDRRGITILMACALASRAGVKVSRATVYNHIQHPRRLPMVDFLVGGLGVPAADLFPEAKK